MSLSLHRSAELSEKQIADLDRAMTLFYLNPPPRYYQMADRPPAQYNERETPFHFDLIGRVYAGATVLEAGCGTAHLCPLVEKKGGHYSGLDHSEELLAANRRRFPQARFFPLQAPPEQTFDIVASLYTIEHIADPPQYLERLWKFCRPGGTVALICPEFVASPGFAPSIFYGRTPRRFSKKLLTGHLADAAAHWLDLKIRARHWKKTALASPPGAFWINLQPRILHENDYDIDTDAVHLVQLRDLLWFYKNKGAEILQTSETMTGVADEVRRYNCYLVVKKPGS